MAELLVNGERLRVDADPGKPLLWVLREDLGLPGTKFGCGIGACGACTVHLDGEAARACVVPLADAVGRAVTTIEGLGGDGAPSRVQQAWLDEQVPQCGYCQPGLIMAADALLRADPPLGEAELEAALDNVCRCGTYPRVRRALARLMAEPS